MKLTSADILRVLREMLPDLRDRYKVHSMALFGSFARGEQRDDSDVDILIDFDPSIGLGFVSLADEIEATLGRPVHVVSTRALKARHRAFIEPDLINV